MFVPARCDTLSNIWENLRACFRPHSQFTAVKTSFSYSPNHPTTVAMFLLPPSTPALTFADVGSVSARVCRRLNSPRPVNLLANKYGRFNDTHEL